MVQYELFECVKCCCTCKFWESKLKGYCTKIGQGVGKFHYCESWVSGRSIKEDHYDLITRKCLHCNQVLSKCACGE